MCTRKVGTINASFEISAHDWGAMLSLARSEGIESDALYRRAVAEYLINHAPAEWWVAMWPVGDDLTSESHGSAPMATG
jgi:hypothetical protein